MTRPPSSDPYVEAKLLGILLSGALSQTRPDCSLGVTSAELPEPRRSLSLEREIPVVGGPVALERHRLEQQPSGVYRIVLGELDSEGEL
jgi:hypothetical protein